MTAALCACSPQTIHQQVSGTLQVTSTTIANGKIPDGSGCKGDGTSPQISWSNPPAGTKSVAVLMEDRDGTSGHIHKHYYTHWVVFDMPADRHELAAGQPRQALPDGTQQGTNDLGELGYGGPCPSVGLSHRYVITVYALDTKLGLPADTKERQLLSAIDGHILARGELAGVYAR